MDPRPLEVLAVEVRAYQAQDRIEEQVSPTDQVVHSLLRQLPPLETADLEPGSWTLTERMPLRRSLPSPRSRPRSLSQSNPIGCLARLAGEHLRCWQEPFHGRLSPRCFPGLCQPWYTKPHSRPLGYLRIWGKLPEEPYSFEASDPGDARYRFSAMYG